MNEATAPLIQLPATFPTQEKSEEKKKSIAEIVLPVHDKLISSFAEELADVLKNKNTIFYRIDSKDIVEIGKIKIHKTGKEAYTGFITVRPDRFVTLIEKYVETGVNWNTKTGANEFEKKSISAHLATIVLASQIFQQEMPQISRIFTVPIPILYEGKLTFPEKGYDIRFGSWMPYGAPEISNPKMSLEEAKGIIETLFKEFCFQNEKQDRCNAIAALLTPFLRGLFSSFNTRTPVNFYLANRERAGKDYLAGITGIVFEGNSLEEPPISNNERGGNSSSEELRKKLLAAMIHGRKRLHFANNKGYIDNAVFESVVTSEYWEDRLLGKNDLLKFANELDFSLSGNTGIRFTPDFANRCRFIRLFLDIENANERKFEKPDLHKWVKENRSLILSALFALVRDWQNNGAKKGLLLFASFHEWAEICGGIMENAGYGNPCVSDDEIALSCGDIATSNMKNLFEICYEKKPDEWLSKQEIQELIQKEDSIFGYLDFEKRSGQTKFGLKLAAFTGRILSDIKMIVDNPAGRPSRQKFKFIEKATEVVIRDYYK